MMDVFIAATSYYLPGKELTNELINANFPEWGVEKISQKTGIYTRHIAEDNEFASDMAVKAALKLFEEHDIDRSTIDFILYCTQSPDYFLPTTACIIQNALQLPTGIGALDFNLGCSGFVYGLGLAKGLVMSGSAKKVLLITAETYSKFIHPGDKSNLTIFGDAAAATLITRDEGPLRIGDFVYGTDGRGSENLIVRNGGIRNRALNGKDEFGEEGFKRNDNNLYMNGAAIFQFTSQAVPELVNKTLAANHVAKEDVDMFIFHQANKYMLDYIRKKIGIEESKCFYFLQDCGNTVSSTIPIALNGAIADNKVNAKSKVLLAGFGVGYSWAGCILN
jgi:3-oxoacyl-[acyl-carrier-protein] synthase-3